jgi:hypothetical protein
MPGAGRRRAPAAPAPGAARRRRLRAARFERAARPRRRARPRPRARRRSCASTRRARRTRSSCTPSRSARRTSRASRPTRASSSTLATFPARSYRCWSAASRRSRPTRRASRCGATRCGRAPAALPPGAAPPPGRAGRGSFRGRPTARARPPPRRARQAVLAAKGGDSVFRVVETNDFKQLPHITLTFRPGNDAAIKQARRAAVARGAAPQGPRGRARRGGAVRGRGPGRPIASEARRRGDLPGTLAGAPCPPAPSATASSLRSGWGRCAPTARASGRSCQRPRRGAARRDGRPAGAGLSACIGCVLGLASRAEAR